MTKRVTHTIKKAGLLAIIAFGIGLSPTHAFAVTMSGSNFILHSGTFDTTGGSVSNSTNKLTFGSGQLDLGETSGNNYKVCAGILSTKCLQQSTASFGFSLSGTTIDFGILSATNPVTRTVVLGITNASTKGYAVTVSEDHALQFSTSGSTIPDTTCDNGACSEMTGAPWTSTLTYGFGYRCDNVTGSDCSPGFSTTSYYKQFANLQKNKIAQPVMKGTTANSTPSVQITYKLNIAGTQQPGTYTNTLTYIATPNY